MPAGTDWIKGLDNVFDYQALQRLFSEIAQQAEADGVVPGLGQKIDDVILRIEEERASDQRELDGIQERYESFQQSHRGVVGWFKRHIPFTESRRQDVQQRAELADQQAEVLADNLVIARAQLLKERFLAPAERRLGRRTVQWRVEFDAAHGTAALAASLNSLHPELNRARGFLELVRTDIEAFAGAVFSAKEDRQRRDADLQMARRELAEVTAEFDEKAKLKHNALVRMGRLVTDELTASDGSFRDDARQLIDLAAAQEQWNAAHRALAELMAAAQRVGDQTRELQSLPGQIQQSRFERQQFERRQAEAALSESRKIAIADERRLRFEEARRRVEEAQRALANVQQADADWRAEQAPEKSMPQMVEAGGANSPYATRLSEAKAAVDQAHAAMRVALQSFDTARQDGEQIRSTLAAARGQVAGADFRIAALEQRTAQLQKDLPESRHAGQAAFAKTAAAVASCFNERAASAAASPPAGCVSGGQLNAAWGEALLHADRDLARHLQALALAEQLAQWLRARQDELQHQRAAVIERHTAAFRRRCRELLADELAAEVPLDSIAA